MNLASDEEPERDDDSETLFTTEAAGSVSSVPNKLIFLVGRVLRSGRAIKLKYLFIQSKS